ncbi:hypothetical protein [Massilia aquatica]|uniref:Uncharacterized protein n=1 Tax=Massilia aquatica TaxID=2609000 RepID=A0ABX0MAU1_9BURK|nr:hypothetical protein [Massilia aquatica]NHZ44324.1 hypothetical protein [Massilia aquatica]
MKVQILGDFNHESGVNAVTDWFSDSSYWEAFATDYGDGLWKVAIFLICRNPELNFKQRIRHSKKDKALYMDIMLPLADFVNATLEERKENVVVAMLKEVPRIVRKYKFAEFDTEAFLSDFDQYFSGLLAQLPRPSTLAA